MYQFEYFLPLTIEDACNLLSENSPHAKILAGGTDLLIELRNPSSQSPKAIIDVSRLQELNGVEESGNWIILKPLTTHNDILHSKLIHQYAPLLEQAVSTIGSPQIRNRGTIGGNIMNAAACADTVPPLMALQATLKLQSGGGERNVPMTEFFVKPYQTVAAPNEILTEIRFPKLWSSDNSAFIKLGRRNALSIARLSVAAILQKNANGQIQGARIVPGAAFPGWQRMADAEKILIGQKPSKELFTKAGEKVSELMISVTGRRWSTEYKEPVIAVLVRRALEACQ